MNASSRAWPVVAIVLAFASIASFFTAYAQPADPPKREPSAAIQPASSVEATALAIAYDALKAGDAKVTSQTIGQFAAEIMNAMSAARK